MARFSGAGKAIFYFSAFVTSILAVVAGVALFQFWLFLRLPGEPARESRRVIIPPGASAAATAHILHAQGIVSDPWKFHVLCWAEKAGQKLRAGEYAFLPLSSPDQILDQIITGKAILHRVTFPEGAALRDVGEILERQGLASKKTILRLAEDPDFIRTLGLDVPSLEGYLFPDTYNFQKTQDERAMLKIMVAQFRRRFPEEWKEQAQAVGLSVRDAVILASLVEKEAKVDSERPIIAAVFLNRLKRDMPLQSDPTAVYDLEGFSGPVTAAQLKRKSPYNTYLNKGLPPGPICSPGSKSLHAALYPDKVPYLYFVSNNDGTHHFSETVEEHNEAVSAYREKRKAATRKEADAANQQPAPTPAPMPASAPGDAKESEKH